MLILASLTRVILNSVGKVYSISTARLIVHGKRLYAQYAVISRGRAHPFLYGMFPVAAIAPELEFCRQEHICYNWNLFKCWNLNCPLYHVCKRCWRFDIEEDHASNDPDRCQNMSENYRTSLERSGTGGAPPNYYVLGPPDEQDRGRGDDGSQERGLDNQTVRISQVVTQQSTSNASRGEDESQQIDPNPPSCKVDGCDKYKKTLEMEVHGLREELRKEKTKTEELIKEKCDLVSKLETKEKDNDELRGQLVEIEGKGSKTRIIDSYSRLNFVTGYPPGFDQSLRQTNQDLNLGKVSVPPLFHVGNKETDSPELATSGSKVSNGSGNSKELDIFNLYKNTDDLPAGCWFK